MQQERVHVVFSPDRSSVTVSAEVWEGGQRIAAFVWPPEAFEESLMGQAAAGILDAAFPPLLDR